MLIFSKKNWITKQLGELSTLRRELVNPSEIKGGEQMVGLEHINGEDGSVTSVPALEANIKSTKARFCSGDILYGKLRPYLRKITIPSFDGLCSTDILALRVNKKLADKRYLFHFLRQQGIVDFATDRSAGVNLPRLSPSVLLEIPIHMPEDVRDQTAIADILDMADRIQAKRHQAFNLADELLRSIFLDMFGDPATNAKCWPIKVLGDVISGFESGKNVNPASSEIDGGPYRVLKVSAVTWGDYQPKESKPLPQDYFPPDHHLVKVGDLLFSRANTVELIGATTFVFSTPPNHALPDKIWKFKWLDPSPVDPLFLWSLFQTTSVRKEIGRRATGTGGSMKNISQEKVLSLPLYQPPLDLQRKYALILRQQKTLQAKYLQGLTEYKNLLLSLQQRAFLGDL